MLLHIEAAEIQRIARRTQVPENSLRKGGTIVAMNIDDNAVWLRFQGMRSAVRVPASATMPEEIEKRMHE